VSSLRRYADSLEADPARQEQIESRLAALEDAARKHRVETAQLPRCVPGWPASCRSCAPVSSASPRSSDGSRARATPATVRPPSCPQRVAMPPRFWTGASPP